MAAILALTVLVWSLQWTLAYDFLRYYPRPSAYGILFQNLTQSRVPTNTKNREPCRFDPMPNRGGIDDLGYEEISGRPDQNEEDEYRRDFSSSLGRVEGKTTEIRFLLVATHTLNYRRDSVHSSHFP